MNFTATLETRPCAPIVLPEIPRCEIAVPMPMDWIERLRAKGPDPGYAVFLICCRALAYDLPCPVSLREDFPVIWKERLACHAIPSGPWGVSPVPIRADVWQCVESAAALVNRPAHEVFLKVLARQISVWEEEETENQHKRPVVHAVKHSREANPAPGKLIAGPWKPRPCVSD